MHMKMKHVSGICLLVVLFCFSTSEAQPRGCPMIWCFVPCGYGKEVDANGCDTCKCLPPPTGERAILPTTFNFSILDILKGLSPPKRSHMTTVGDSSKVLSSQTL